MAVSKMVTPPLAGSTLLVRGRGGAARISTKGFETLDPHQGPLWFLASDQGGVVGSHCGNWPLPGPSCPSYPSLPVPGQAAQSSGKAGVAVRSPRGDRARRRLQGILSSKSAGPTNGLLLTLAFPGPINQGSVTWKPAFTAA